MINLSPLLTSNQQPATSNYFLAIAVSGGADSMALLLLAHNWAKENGGKIVALTVDHGLRAEAKVEAAQVATWCETRSIEHHILTWDTPKSKQADARDARYRLLTDWCHAHGATTLLTAHHLGDQAETLFFRLARGSNFRGLACIQTVSELHGIRLVRPLLGSHKKELVDYLQRQEQEWIEDPSNRNMHYTRNALRAQLQSLPNAEDIERRAGLVAAAFARIRAKIDEKTGMAFSRAITRPAEGGAIIDAAAFAELPPETALLVLAELIQQLTGDDHPPRTEKLERLLVWLASPDSQRATLAHLCFDHHPAQNRFRVSLVP